MLLTEHGGELAARFVSRWGMKMIRSKHKSARWVFGLLCLFMPFEAQADWRSVIQGLRVAVVDANDPMAAIERMKPFAEHLEAQLQIRVEIVAFQSYNAVIEAQADGRIDVATHSSSSFAAARALCDCIDILGVPASSDGTTHFYGIAVTRRSDNVEGLQDLNGRTVAFGDKQATATNQVPAAVLREKGQTPASYFSSMETFSNHVKAVQALRDRSIDAVFTWSSLVGDINSGYSRGPLQRAVRQNRIKMSEIDIIWTSVPIPHGPITVRANLPQDLKSALQDQILDLFHVNAAAYFALEPWFGFGYEKPDNTIYSDFADLLGYIRTEQPGAAAGVGSIRGSKVDVKDKTSPVLKSPQELN